MIIKETRESIFHPNNLVPVLVEKLQQHMDSDLLIVGDETISLKTVNAVYNEQKFIWKTAHDDFEGIKIIKHLIALIKNKQSVNAQIKTIGNLLIHLYPDIYEDLIN